MQLQQMPPPRRVLMNVDTKDASGRTALMLAAGFVPGFLLRL